MSFLHRVEQGMLEEADGPLRHFWPSLAILKLYACRIHGTTFPRASRANAGTPENYWLTEVGILLFEYVCSRVHDQPAGIMILSSSSQRKTWPYYVQKPQ